MPEIAQIPLSNGDVVLIDAEAWPLVSQYNWRVNVNDREGWVQVRAWTKRVEGEALRSSSSSTRDASRSGRYDPEQERKRARLTERESSPLNSL